MIGVGNRVFRRVLYYFGECSLAEVKATNIGQLNKIEENIGELLFEVFLVIRSPIGKSFRNFAFPLEDLGEFSNFSNLHKQPIFSQNIFVVKRIK